MWVVSDERKN